MFYGVCEFCNLLLWIFILEIVTECHNFNINRFKMLHNYYNFDF